MIPPKFVQHRIELDTSIPLADQTRYVLNPNYATTIKHDIDKLLVVGFLQLVEEATWLSPITLVPTKNEKLRICVNFKKFNKATKNKSLSFMIF
jgi:hypothetical protein